MASDDGKQETDGEDDFVKRYLRYIKMRYDDIIDNYMLEDLLVYETYKKTRGFEYYVIVSRVFCNVKVTDFFKLAVIQRSKVFYAVIKSFEGKNDDSGKFFDACIKKMEKIKSKLLEKDIPDFVRRLAGDFSDTVHAGVNPESYFSEGMEYLGVQINHDKVDDGITANIYWSKWFEHEKEKFRLRTTEKEPKVSTVEIKRPEVTKVQKPKREESESEIRLKAYDIMAEGERLATERIKKYGWTKAWEDESDKDENKAG